MNLPPKHPAAKHGAPEPHPLQKRKHRHLGGASGTRVVSESSEEEPVDTPVYANIYEKLYADILR